jgi:hypothetical protein
MRRRRSSCRTCSTLPRFRDAVRSPIKLSFYQALYVEVAENAQNTAVQADRDAPVARDPDSATASHDETREVLRLATAALEDPRCDAAALRAASFLHHEFTNEEPVTLESYRAALKRYAGSTPLLNEDVFRKARAMALLLLKFKQLDYSRASAGKSIAAFIC